MRVDRQFQEGRVEYHSELMDSSCPKCPWPDDPMLAIVSYPTMAETEANSDKLSKAEREEHHRRREFLDRLKAQQLSDPNQLCNLEGDSFKLTWDLVTAENGEHRNVVRWGEKTIWDEPAGWESYNRFAEVATILKAKYGKQFVDLEPTAASLTYLLGDCLSASDKVDEARRRIGDLDVK